MGSSGAASNHPPKSSLLQQLLVRGMSAHPRGRRPGQGQPSKRFGFSFLTDGLHLASAKARRSKGEIFCLCGTVFIADNLNVTLH